MCLPTFASIIDHNASRTGSTCCVVALVCATRMIATIMTRILRENIAASVDFSFLLMRSPGSRKRNGTKTANSQQPRLMCGGNHILRTSLAMSRPVLIYKLSFEALMLREELQPPDTRKFWLERQKE